MISVNEVEEGYDWKNSYEPLILKTISLLIESYTIPLKFNKVKLQYVDAYDLNDEIIPIDFISKNLQTRIINNYELPGDLKNLSLQQSFALTDDSYMNLNISDGINNFNGKKSIIWTTTVEKTQVMSFDEIKNWIAKAHDVCSTMFKKMLNSEFYASLDK